ncbi:MAG TPA: CPCC family cysteine-rich protein [Polyangium sp.]|nr:CPCC family cysteine-rich protein [Polyangium sp.]
MSYRRKRSDHAAERAWHEWLEVHRDALASSGLPLEFYSSRVSWEEFLSTGSGVFGSGPNRREFDFNTLSVTQQQHLHAFLERVVATEEPPPGLLRFLRVRAGHDWQPPFIGPEPKQHDGEPSAILAQCPCCDYFSLGHRGEYEICEICFWEDAGLDLDDLDQYSGPNHMTLRDARENFRRIGACDERALSHALPMPDRVRFRREPR